jgi:hypothetical protein
VNTDSVVQLRDIQGLDTVPWWPPGTGWWLLAVVAVILVFLLVAAVRNLRRFPVGSWRRHAWRELRMLKVNAPNRPAQQVAIELSELLRRIAIARLGRSRTAGISGERWLSLLQANDPAGFAWSQHGKLLLSLPYAPPGTDREHNQQLQPLIDAAIAWVDHRGGVQHA